jgi:hypothetical protein
VPTPWLRLDGGDGGWNGIVEDGGLVRNIKGTAATQAFASASGFIDKGVIPIHVPPPTDPTGVTSPIGDVVRHPAFRNAFGQRMFAVAGNFGKPTEVYGIFQNGPEQTYHWERLGSTPANLAVSAAASFDGGTVMVAAGAGRIFAMDSKSGTSIELFVDLPKPSPATLQSGGGIPRIAMLRADIGFAILNSTNLQNNYILRLEGLKWSVPLSNNLPTNAAFYGLDGFLRADGRPVIFAATDERVYLSEDAGENWVQASLNLPRVPHCADLRVARIADAPSLLLSTFGRSLWRADMRRLHAG